MVVKGYDVERWCIVPRGTMCLPIEVPRGGGSTASVRTLICLGSMTLEALFLPWVMVILLVGILLYLVVGEVLAAAKHYWAHIE